ncbi:MAG TPA: metallophosphoesterase family protein [Candidatus Limnocylindria bacterium]|nr:metallophosphoesterase family protein [Candidatus Limnocylindria bacterium]
MRVALLSDVHANLQALEAVLAALDEQGKPDALWVTGDTVGYGGDPSEVIASLRARGALLLQGNHDRAVATGEGLDIFNERAATAAALHAKWLSAEERDFLGGLPPVTSVERFTLCHGSLRDPMWEYVTSASGAAASLARAQTPFACHGHTHLPALFSGDGGALRAMRPTPDTTYELGATSLVNPGSVGQPRDGDPRAAFATLDTAAGSVTFHRATYDVSAAQRRIRARRLPEIFADRLAVGV